MPEKSVQFNQTKDGIQQRLSDIESEIQLLHFVVLGKQEQYFINLELEKLENAKQVESYLDNRAKGLLRIYKYAQIIETSYLVFGLLTKMTVLTSFALAWKAPSSPLLNPGMIASAVFIFLFSAFGCINYLKEKELLFLKADFEEKGEEFLQKMDELIDKRHKTNPEIKDIIIQIERLKDERASLQKELV